MALLTFALATTIVFSTIFIKEQGEFVGLWAPSILALGSLLTNSRKEGDHV